MQYSPFFAALWLLPVLLGTAPELQGQVPRGSYEQSCKDIRVSGTTLMASCKGRNQVFQATQLADFRHCVGQIENQDGHLHCSKGAPPPRGPYTSSCRDIFMNGRTLSASCRARDGRFVPSTLADVSKCAGPIENFEGRLACSTGGPLPAGSYSASCRDILRMGNTLQANCKNRAGAFLATRLDNIHQCVGPIEAFDGKLGCSTGSAPPPGSYTQSCRDIFRTGNTLHASCKNRAGAFVSAKLDNINQCVGPIEAFDGALGCSTGGAPPPGSYTQSCRDIFRTGNTLHASCKTRDGRFVATTLDNINQCAGPIEEFDGQLACSTGALPPGSYRDSCRDIIRAGTLLRASCRAQSGQFVPASLDRFDRCIGGIVNFNGALRCGSPQYSYVPPAKKRPVPAGRQCSGAPSPTGLYRKEWMRLGGPNGPMGCPVSGVQKHPEGGVGGEIKFQNGAISFSPDVWPNGILGAFQDGGSIVMDWSVNWDDQRGFNYDKFLVRWDVNGAHESEDDQVDVLADMTADQLVLMKYKEDTHLRTRGNFVVDVSKIKGPSIISVKIEGCDLASKVDPFSTSTCRQGWLHAANVLYRPPPNDPHLDQVGLIDLSATAPAKSVADSKTTFDDRAAAALMYNACALLPHSAYRHEENYGLFLWAKLAYADYFQSDHCPGRDVKNRDEALQSLMRQHVESKTGTTHDSKPFRTGEYDVFLTSLLPMVYKYGRVLPPAAVDHIVDELLNQRGPLDSGQLDVFGLVPESENHVMNIETARYLTNQWVFTRTADPQFDNSRNGMDDWMLHHLQEFLKTDFIEYNARPYQDYSITALLNLYSFTSAQNPSSRRVKMAAEMVLDYLMAKAAVSMNDSRRLAPFRRRVDHNGPDMLSVQTDPQTAFSMMFAGTTEILNEFVVSKFAPNNFGWEMQFAGVDDYRVPDPILDLMIERSHRSFFQRLHHYADEAYAGSPSYLLSAGGHYATFAYRFAGVAGDHDDIGLALPTTLLPDGRFHLLSDLIRFEGDSDDAKRSNMCVTRDFACGLKPQVPDRYGANCMSTQGRFTFVNQSGACPSGRPGTGYYVAIYRDQDLGFLEAFDTALDPSVTFEQFQAGVMRRNGAAQFNRTGQNTYIKSNNEKVVFELIPNSKVIGPPDTPFFASGTVINSALNSAFVTIDNPALHQQLVLDMRDASKPQCTGCTVK
ncbi:MAG TPA: CVNH domain-containing protein [Candidatus Saccharimonadales bacterium]|nr:CVNH domain-containing protein [Candidatus Saccharimonadales bacterium]